MMDHRSGYYKIMGFAANVSSLPPTYVWIRDTITATLAEFIPRRSRIRVAIITWWYGIVIFFTETPMPKKKNTYDVLIFAIRLIWHDILTMKKGPILD